MPAVGVHGPPTPPQSNLNSSQNPARSNRTPNDGSSHRLQVDTHTAPNGDRPQGQSPLSKLARHVPYDAAWCRQASADHNRRSSPKRTGVDPIDSGMDEISHCDPCAVFDYGIGQACYSVSDSTG